MSIAVYVITLSCFLASTLASSNLKGETGKMRRLALTIAMACVLSGAVRAGEIHSTGVIATPTPTPTTAYGEIHTTGVVGEIPTNGVATAEEIPSTGTTAALTIILTIISIVP